jgi:hypothetical protein
MSFLNKIDVLANAKDGVGDYVGKFWVVTKPTEDSELIDILFFSDIGGMMLQAKGGLAREDIVGLYPKKDKDKAEKHAKDLLEKIKNKSKKDKRPRYKQILNLD